jgi:hypothetical protein
MHSYAAKAIDAAKPTNPETLPQPEATSVVMTIIQTAPRARQTTRPRDGGGFGVVIITDAGASEGLSSSPSGSGSGIWSKQNEWLLCKNP